MTPRRIVAFLATFLLVPVLVLLPSGHAAPQSVAPAETQAPGEIRVAAANVFEGSLVRYRADRRNGTDRQAFANRLLGQAAAMPDVVLVQEALGTDGLIAAALNAHPRSAQTGTRFVQLGTTSHGFGTGTCDGWRPGRFSVLRSSAILVNARTVTAVNDQGVLRTWGRWHKRAWKHTGRKGHGCTEHPWARITVTHPETARGPRW